MWQQEGLHVAASVAARGFKCGSGVAARGCICGSKCGSGVAVTHVFWTCFTTETSPISCQGPSLKKKPSPT